MKRLSVWVMIFSSIAGVLLAACGPEGLPAKSGQDQGRSAQAAPSPTATALALSPLATPAELPTQEAQEIEMITGRTPAPTPDLAAATQTELDQFALSNPRALQVPAELGQAPLGLIAWSPDSKTFLANAIGAEVLQAGQAGYSVPDLYLGDGETGEVTFLAHNAGWPAWSRDGSAIYYLAGRVEGDRVQHDLVRSDPALTQPELVVSGVGDSGSQPAVSELADGRLVLLDSAYQVSILDKESLLPVADLVGLEAIRGKQAGFSVAPDGHSLVVLGQEVPATLIDLDTGLIEATLNGPVQFANSVAWSKDSSRLAYGTADGVTVYDRATKTSQAVADRDTFQFPRDDVTASFQTPVWSPDEHYLLFAAATKDWERPGRLHVDTAYTFIVPIGGASLKAVSDKAMAVAPSRILAIEFRRHPDTDQETPTLVDLTWPGF